MRPRAFPTEYFKRFNSAAEESASALKGEFTQFKRLGRVNTLREICRILPIPRTSMRKCIVATDRQFSSISPNRYASIIKIKFLHLRQPGSIPNCSVALS